MIERLTPPAARIGTVISGGATPVIALDGAEQVTVRYMSQGLTLVATDRVLVVRAAGGTWVVTNRLTTPAAVAPPRVVRLAPVNCWVKGTRLEDPPGSWNSQIDYAQFGPAEIEQGQHTGQAGADGLVTPTVLLKYGTVLYWGTLASLVPSGSVILDIALSFTRELPANAKGQPPLTYPRVYGHAYTTASPPNAANPPAAVPGFGPLAPAAAIAPGQTTTIGLPSSWVTAWAAGTIHGLHLYSDQRSDAIRTGGSGGPVQLVITYQPPPEA
jgi:hypothetical protein